MLDIGRRLLRRAPKRVQGALKHAADVAGVRPRGALRYGRDGGVYIKPEDYPAILESIRAVEVETHPDAFVDWSGTRTVTSLLPWFPAWAGRVSTDLPIPDDGYRSEAIEYVGLALSIWLGVRRKEYSVLELGAGWAPWATAGVAIAKRNGVANVRGVAVEASAEMCNAAIAHARANGLSASLGPAVPSTAAPVEITVVNAAVWHTMETLYFPRTGAADMGAAASATREHVDYRGSVVDMAAVLTVAFADLVRDRHFNLCHIDVQGSEFELLAKSEDLRASIDLLAIGTHSRSIEGRLLELLFGRGWQLLAELPATAAYDGSRPSLEGFTVRDGEQLWLSPDAGISSTDLIGLPQTLGARSR